MSVRILAGIGALAVLWMGAEMLVAAIAALWNDQEHAHSGGAVALLAQQFAIRDAEWQNEAEQCRRNYLHEMAEREKAHARIAALEVALSRQQDEIQQTLGAALGYPRYADDQQNFPGAVPADGVCVGDHVAESISKEAADRIAALERENEALRKALEEFLGAQCSEGGCCCQHGEPTEALAAALSKPRDGK